MNDLDQRLAALRTPAPDAAAAARALDAGLAALDRARDARLDQWVARWERGYGRAEPVLALIVAVIDVTWALSAAF